MSTKSSLRPTLSLLLGAILAVSACGVSIGDDEKTGIGAPAGQHSEDQDSQDEPAEDQSSEDQDPEDQSSEDQDPEATVDSDEADASGSVAAPVATSIPSLADATDAQIQPVSDQNSDQNDDQNNDDAEKAFCEASADYWAASNATPYIDLGRPGEVSMLYKLMDTRLDDAIALAPSEELAQPALVAREHFTILYAAATEARYDLDVLKTGNVYNELEPSLKTLVEIDNLLGTYLVGSCGYSRTSLEDGARSVADDIARLVDEVLADSNTVDGDYPGDYIEIADSTDRLKVEVPVDWEDAQSEPSATGSALTIAPDVSTYLTTWRADGIKMTVKDATRPVDWRAPMYETNASADCTLISSEPYSDSLYTGWIDRYDNCGGGPASAVVVGATDEDFSVEILVEVQFDNVDTQNDEATLRQVLDTFKAR